MVIGLVKGFKYDKGEFDLTQGHSSYARSGYKNGRYVNQRGYGWASECKPSRITLKVEVDGELFDVWVDRYFKDNWGRLTAGRLDAIQRTTPREIELVGNVSNNGTFYYTVTDSCMDSWLKNAMRVH